MSHTMSDKSVSRMAVWYYNSLNGHDERVLLPIGGQNNGNAPKHTWRLQRRPTVFLCMIVYSVFFKSFVLNRK